MFGKYKQCIREILSRLKIKNPDKDTVREMFTFYDIYLQLRDMLNFPENNLDAYIEQLEADFWTDKIKYKLAIEIYVNGRPSVGLIETMFNMPNSAELLAFLETTHSPIQAKMYLRNINKIAFKPLKSLREIEVLWNEGRQDFISQIGTPEIEDTISNAEPEKDSGAVTNGVPDVQSPETCNADKT